MVSKDKLITSVLMGGLGNQMFQIATALSLGISHNVDVAFNLTSYICLGQGHIPIFYKNNLYKNLNFLYKHNYKFKLFTETSADYTPIPYDCDYLKLYGFFQSDKYFKNHSTYITNTLIPASIVTELLNTYGDILDAPNCAIHVRRGDFLYGNPLNSVCSVDYYKKAIKLFNLNTKFIVFSDDLNYCRTIFDSENFVFVDTGADYTDLLLMSMCEHQIIANSSFSWWGSWFNQNPHKIVVAPKTWYKHRNNPKDIYRDDMLCL